MGTEPTEVASPEVQKRQHRHVPEEGWGYDMGLSSRQLLEETVGEWTVHTQGISPGGGSPVPGPGRSGRKETRPLQGKGGRVLSDTGQRA